MRNLKGTLPSLFALHVTPQRKDHATPVISLSFLFAVVLKDDIEKHDVSMTLFYARSCQCGARCVYYYVTCNMKRAALLPLRVLWEGSTL